MPKISEAIIKLKNANPKILSKIGCGPSLSNVTTILLKSHLLICIKNIKGIK